MKQIAERVRACTWQLQHRRDSACFFVQVLSHSDGKRIRPPTFTVKAVATQVPLHRNYQRCDASVSILCHRIEADYVKNEAQRSVIILRHMFHVHL